MKIPSPAINRHSRTRESYDRAKETLKIMQEKVGMLTVTAPISGQLTSLDAEIGQTKTTGYPLAQIDSLGGFKVRLTDVDEHYVSRVFPGQTGTFTLQSDTTTYVLRITQVFSAITNGRFMVDMKFVGKVPQGLRKGQTLQVTLALER